MNPKLLHSWIPAQKVEAVVQTEAALIVFAVAISSWLIYKLFLGGLTIERHRNLRRLFRNLAFHSTYATSFFILYTFGQRFGETNDALVRFLPYVGLLAIFSGSTVFVKACRIIAFEYLFAKNMRVGVPVLLVNLFTLLLSVLIFGWILSGIFGFNLVPLLATSAIFSIVLGLAVQDTLGNLIAGVALQFDKPYEIGDWIEIANGTQRWAGQVEEISWRATRLLAFTEELITIPNRVISQAEVSNFSARTRPFVRSHIFKVPVNSHRGRVRAALFRSLANLPEVCRHPKPLTLLVETNESWLAFKMVYYIKNYGRQAIIGDEVYESALAELAKEGIKLANPKLMLMREELLPQADT